MSGIGKYSRVNFAEERPFSRFPAAGVAVTALNGHAHLVGAGSMLGEGLVTNTMGSFGYRTDLGNPIAEAVVIPPIFNKHPTNIGTVIGEGVATCLFGIYGAGGTGAIEIRDEGVLVLSGATILNFIGADVLAKSGGGTQADIYVPSPSYYSHWNTSDGTNNNTVANVATSARYVASPTAPGVPFYTNGWDDAATHPCTRTSPLTWSAGLCLFDDLLTIFTVTVTDPSGTIATHNITNISSNQVSSANNITISISGWTTNADKYAANISVSFDVNAELPNSGYFAIDMTHLSGGTPYTKTQ